MRNRSSTPVKDRWEGKYDKVENNDSEKMRDLSKHRDKERNKKEEKDHRSGDRARTKDASKDREREIDRRKDDRDDREKDRNKEKRSEKDIIKERDHDRAKEKSRTREKEREKEKEKDKYKDRERDRVNDKDRHRDSLEREKEKEREKDRGSKKRHRDEGHDKGKEEERKDDNLKEEREEGELVETRKYVKVSSRDEVDNNRSRKYHEIAHGKIKSNEVQISASELEGRISKMKEERLHKQPEGDSDILSWVSKSRKIEEKRNSAKEKALRLSKVFEEQDDVNEDDFEVDIVAKHSASDLAGVKVLHGLDKVLEGGAVVLTLKDQSILADGDLNEEADVLENVEIGEQKRRNEAYKAAKKKTGTYEDKFNDEPGFVKKMLPQYDDTAADEGITLDAAGRFTGEAEKKLEELRKRIQGVPTNNHFEDLNSSEKIVSDYYTPEEMLKFNKPKKKKSLRKREKKLDLDALEAEAVNAGLGDLGSRNNNLKREAIKEEQEKKEAEIRNKAYQAAYAKADEASKTLRVEKSEIVKIEEEYENSVYGDDDEELRKSLQRARKVALKKQDETSNSSSSGPEAIARLASLNPTATLTSGGEREMQENKVVFTEMEEFVGGLQLDEEAHKPDSEDVFMEEDLAPNSSDQEMIDIKDGGWTEINKNNEKEELSPDANETESSIVHEDTIHEAPVGKGLSGALKMLKDRGTLKETVEWGGRNMDKKKSKLLGIHEHGDGKEKEIRLERTDEYGRILTPKEAFRLLSHKFHGKGPGKMKQEKRMRQYEEELKIKRMKNSDTPSQSVERMREAQAQLKTPYLVLSGHVKPGQTSDPTSGFATVEKNLPGSLTPMLGDRKVEHFLGIRRKSEPGNMGPPPPKKGSSTSKKPGENVTPKNPEKKE